MRNIDSYFKQMIPPLCKGRLGGVDIVETSFYPPQPSLTKGGNSSATASTKEGISLFVVALLLLASCGGGSSSYSTTCKGACGVAQVVVTNSKSFNPNVEHGRIVSYRVTVSGEGFSPIVKEFDGEETSGVVDGIPTGRNRQITVEAVNPNSSIIRQGETAGVSIEGGRTAEVEVALSAVPIFTNLAEGNTLDNTRLVFEIFSEPTSPVVIEDATDNSSAVLADASTMDTQINPDVSTGFGKMAPPLQGAGEHKYLVKDSVTGKSSQITVILTDGMKHRGAPLFVGGDGNQDAARRVSW